MNAKQRLNIVFVSVAVIVMAAAAIISSYSVVGAAGIVFVIAAVIPLALALLHYPRLGLTLIILSVIPGNLIRLSLGTDVRGGSAILISDIIIPIAVAVWLLRKAVVIRNSSLHR